jgi:hypothetical protein
MKHTFLVFGLGLLGAMAAHLGWYRWHEPCHGPELECQLVWMKTELKLTDAQFERIRAIHEASSPRLLALAAQVARMRDEHAAFERERTTAGQVDFVEFARFVAQRRAIDRECLEATNRLVGATSGIMTAQQRERYLGLVGPALTGRELSPPN